MPRGSNTLRTYTAIPVSKKRSINVNMWGTTDRGFVLRGVLKGFKLSGKAPSRADLPQIRVNDQFAVRIPRSGVFAVAFPTIPTNLHLELREFSERTQRMGQYVTIADFDAKEFPDKVGWHEGGPINIFETVPVNGSDFSIIPMEMGGMQVRNPLNPSKFLGLAMDLLTTIAHEEGRTVSIGGADIRVSELYPTLLGFVIRDLLVGNQRELDAFCDNLVPEGITRGSEAVFLNGAMINHIGEDAIARGLAFLESNNIKLLQSPGVSSWLAGGHLFVKKKFPDLVDHRPLLVIGVGKYGLFYGVGRTETDVVDHVKPLPMPAGFKYEFELPADVTHEERVGHRNLVIDTIADIINRNRIGDHIARPVALVIPGRVVSSEKDPTQRMVISGGGSIPLWPYYGPSLEDDIRTRLKEDCPVILINDAVAATVRGLDLFTRRDPDFFQLLHIAIGGGFGASVAEKVLDRPTFSGIPSGKFVEEESEG
ncbi:MAG: hypothetical protein KKB81_07580 [Candidatus Margulisbacteria bacterium]|nr:hypothetical protein [Candidatus Margulisiibacteriota bacterium]MBU1021209.1 hypothetical protein [Candidatus Margulisiibacteriota bacterium]MBU1729815.1 hypothetical protein [Candidatus Margulisiibacteriota bacterium]MBU1955316.1 hypothetical protein [Candidatus Margulisiibacteriota bacterium]